MNLFEIRLEKSDGAFLVRLQGMSKYELMGDLRILSRLPSYQLPLPLLAKDRLLNQLAYVLTGTN